MGPPFKTRDVYRMLGIPYHLLYTLLRSGRLAPPAKDSAGDYFWTPEDVERARQAIAAGRRRPTNLPPAEEVVNV